MRILLIDSDNAAAVNLGDYLEQRGHSVDYAAGAKLALRLALTQDFHAVVLVARLSGQNGLTLCERLRATSRKSPALLLVGEEVSVAQRVAALDAGADDYLVRSVAIAEQVHARLKALRRRQRRNSPVLQLGDLELDLGSMQARRQGKRLTLTATELKLLQALMEAAPEVLTYHDLESHLWGEGREGCSNLNLRAQIARLRRIIDQPFGTALIQVQRNVGYRMAATEEGRRRCSLVKKSADMATFAFEGEQLTIVEIRQRVPILADSTIRAHLCAGRTTRVAMLSFDPRKASARAARRNNIARNKGRVMQEACAAASLRCDPEDSLLVMAETANESR